LEKVSRRVLSSFLRSRSLRICVELMFLLFIIAGGYHELEKRKLMPVYDTDEVSWIFTGYYFNLYFLHFDLFHPDWYDYEAFDHPPLAKYIVGGSLYLKGYKINSLDLKRSLNMTPDMMFMKKYVSILPHIPNPAITIPWTRSVIFGFALSSLLLTYSFVRISYGALPAFISTLLIISDPNFSTVSTRILADPVLLFFFTMFLLLCTLYLKSSKNIYLLFAFMISALAFLTKLNGIVLLFVLIIAFLIKNKFSIAKEDWRYLFIGFTVFILINAILNPVFLNTGMGAMIKMIEIRLSAFHVFQETFKEFALLSVDQRFFAATQRIFFNSSVFYRYIGIPVELIMFMAGLYYIFKKKDLFMITIFIFLIITPISILPYNIPRYFYWISPFVYIIAGLSVGFFKEICVKGKYLIKKRRQGCETVR
jgi:hypothetical protein